MSDVGPVALTGGGEHLAGCELIERRLLELTGVSRPRVAVIPTAAARRQMPKTAALARNYWGRLGAAVSIAIPECDIDRALDVVGQADIIVLPGGHPNKLVASLGASPVTDLIIERWRQGVAISGSSAGAMCLFEWRIKLYPPNPLRPIPGLGLLDGYVSAPHFDRFRGQRWAHSVLRWLGGAGVIGLDEATALVGRSGALEVVGRGGVTVVDGDGTANYPSGEWAPVDLLRGSKVRLGHASAIRRVGEDMPHLTPVAAQV